MQDSDNNNELSRELRYTADRADEFSLLDIYFVLVKRKKIIIFTVIICVLLSLVYVSTATKKYQVSVRLLMPSPDDLILSTKAKLSPEKVFKDFKISLLRDKLWNSFVSENQDSFNDGKKDLTPGHIENPIELELDSKFVGEHFVARYKSTNAELSALILERYINFVEKDFVQNIVTVYRGQLSRDIAGIKANIRSARKYEKIKRADQMSKLDSELSIAKSLGIHNSREFVLKDESKLTVLTGNTTVPHYMRGTKILEAELASLNERKSDDPYIPGLRENQLKLDSLKSVVINADLIRPFIIDGKIQVPVKISPKGRMAFAVGILLGFILGAIIAFIAEFVQKAPTLRMKTPISNP